MNLRNFFGLMLVFVGLGAQAQLGVPSINTNGVFLAPTNILRANNIPTGTELTNLVSAATNTLKTYIDQQISGVIGPGDGITATTATNAAKTVVTEQAQRGSATLTNLAAATTAPGGSDYLKFQMGNTDITISDTDSTVSTAGRFAGDGGALSNLNILQITNTYIPSTKLASGTPGATKFVKGSVDGIAVWGDTSELGGSGTNVIANTNGTGYRTTLVSPTITGGASFAGSNNGTLYLFDGSSNVIAGFNGSFWVGYGTGLTGITAAAIASGVIDRSRLPNDLSSISNSGSYAWTGTNQFHRLSVTNLDVQGALSLLGSLYVSQISSTNPLTLLGGLTASTITVSNITGLYTTNLADFATQLEGPTNTLKAWVSAQLEGIINSTPTNGITATTATNIAQTVVSQSSLASLAQLASASNAVRTLALSAVQTNDTRPVSVGSVTQTSTNQNLFYRTVVYGSGYTAGNSLFSIIPEFGSTVNTIAIFKTNGTSVFQMTSDTGDATFGGAVSGNLSGGTNMPRTGVVGLETALTALTNRVTDATNSINTAILAKVTDATNQTVLKEQWLRQRGTANLTNWSGVTIASKQDAGGTNRVPTGDSVTVFNDATGSGSLLEYSDLYGQWVVPGTTALRVDGYLYANGIEITNIPITGVAGLVTWFGWLTNNPVLYTWYKQVGVAETVPTGDLVNVFMDSANTFELLQYSDLDGMWIIPEGTGIRVGGSLIADGQYLTNMSASKLASGTLTRPVTNAAVQTAILTLSGAFTPASVVAGADEELIIQGELPGSYGALRAGSVHADSIAVGSMVMSGPTNAAPSNTTTIRAWANFTNSAGGVFKYPLYQ